MYKIILNAVPYALAFLAGKYIGSIMKFFFKKNRRGLSDKKSDDSGKYDFDDADLKMVFLVREDLKMGAGKIAAQVAHAAVGLFDEITSGKDEFHQKALDYWTEYGAKKIVLRAENLEVMVNAAKACKEAKIPHLMISDAGHTQVPAGSVTVLGIGPDESAKINLITGKLKLMR